jgi:CubicO group peptidase (beta-lactamase class C family)
MNLSHRFSCLLLVLLCSACVSTVAVEQSEFNPSATVAPQVSRHSDTYIQNLLEEVVRDGRTVGVVVGLLEADGSRRVFSHGSPGAGARALAAESVFEIGSITKVFTGILLADMVRRGEVELSDPVSQYLPASVRVPSRDGREITLLDLATHRSGLPKMPQGLVDDDYARYTIQHFYDFVSSYELPRGVNESYEYSNVGMALLGRALELRADKPYEALLRERVLDPLGLEHTAVTLTPALEQRLAYGHNAFGDPAQRWDLPAMIPAGSLRSTVHDMLTFAAANLSAITTDAHDSLRDALRVHRPADEEGYEMALGWEVHRRGDRLFASHSGDTWGYGAFLAIDLSTRRAAVALSNAGSAGVSGLEFHLLHPSIPMRERSVSLPVVAAYRTGGLEAAIDRYRELYEEAHDRWVFDEWALNSVGYWLLARGVTDNAVDLFALNVDRYPDAPNPHGSLGYALLRASRPEEALQNYRRGVAVAEAAGHPDLSAHRANLERVLSELAQPD